MGVAYYIVLDNDEPGFDTFVNGKAVARAIDELDALCDEAGLAKLDSFMGQSADDFADLLGEEIEYPEGQEDGNLWFEPQAGVELIDALMEQIEQNRDTFEAPDDLLEDLEEYKQVLLRAEAIGALWHLALDI
ncbi:MAG TPA: hypothetical protein VIF60_02035 [Burkholderiaceae bacterium]|jgi:hypothetical protein